MKAGLGLLAACCAAAVLTAAELPRCDLIPGWTQSGATRLYTAETLYDYMDGNTEGYLIYGFEQMRGVTCHSGDDILVIDVSSMRDSDSAFGLFASNRDPRAGVESLGVSSQVTPQRGILDKGKWFAEISASPSSTDHAKSIRAFLTALNDVLDGVSTAPAPVGWFPDQGLETNSIRLIPQSVLGLSLLKRGYLAKYDYGRAFIVGQPSVEASQQTMNKLRQKFGGVEPAIVGDEAFQAHDKYLGQLLFFRKGAYVAGFTNLTDSSEAVKKAQELATRIP